MASASPGSASAPGRLYYGPALPTDLVESTILEAPGNSVPSGELSRGVFTNSSLGIRVTLPPHWQPLPTDEAYRVTDLMRDPIADDLVSDRRRALFRACSRVVFTAADPDTEMISQVHPALAILAIPRGCVPDLVLPESPDDSSASEDFATALVRSLGAPLLSRASIRGTAQGLLTFDLDGRLGYRIAGEMLSRRLNLRVSATSRDPWLVFIYSVTASLAEQRELESHIALGIADAVPKR
jgi:hypothetical protein